MNNSDKFGSFYILTTIDESNKYCEINEYNDQEDRYKKEKLLYDSTIIPNTDLIYEYSLISLPFEIRKSILLELKDETSFFNASKIAFNHYCHLSKRINNYLSNAYENVYILCSVLYNDFCLLVPKHSYDFDIIEREVNTLFEFYSNPVYNDDIDKNDLLKYNYNRKKQCIESSRQFVKHNPMFHEYIYTMIDLENISSDSIDRKQELSLFSSLVLKDLVEETHLYWLYDSGDLRYEEPEKAYLLKMQNSVYFEYFKIFCNQANDSNIYNNWIWTLVFLTQKLLYILNKETKGIIDSTNFYGFIPIIKDHRKSNNEVISLFTRHISRKFCHSFLIIPTGSVNSMVEYLPAYIHEFFHYIPPPDRIKRNNVVLDLILHAMFIDLYNTCNSNNIYEYFFNNFKNSFIESSKNFYENIFDSDSMEYIDKLKVLSEKLDFGKLYDSAVNKTLSNEFIKCFFESKDDCVLKLYDSFSDYLYTFSLFLREIRSDIAMCDFLGIDIERYIHILAHEPLFACMSREKCGDSTILRFGYMCHHLLKEKSIANDTNWKNEAKRILEDQMNSIDEPNYDKHSTIKNHYINLIGYLDEYCDIGIEKNDTELRSRLEYITEKGGLISSWKEYNKLFSENVFINNLKELYQKHINEKDFSDKLITVCGSKIIFRDLYIFDSSM